MRVAIISYTIRPSCEYLWKWYRNHGFRKIRGFGCWLKNIRLSWRTVKPFEHTQYDERSIGWRKIDWNRAVCSPCVSYRIITWHCMFIIARFGKSLYIFGTNSSLLQISHIEGKTVQTTEVTNTLQAYFEAEFGSKFAEWSIYNITL